MIFIFECRNGKRYYSSNLKDLCREVQNMDGWFVEYETVFLRTKKRLSETVFCDRSYIDMSKYVR